MARASLQEIIIATNATETNVSQFLEKERSFRRYGRLTESLEAASHGIETHKVTYKNDDRFCSLVDVLVKNVRDQLHDMNITLKMTTSSKSKNISVRHNTQPSPIPINVNAQQTTQQFTSSISPPPVISSPQFQKQSTSQQDTDEDEQLEIF